MGDTAAFYSDPRAYTARIPVADRVLELRAVPSPGAYPASAWPTVLLGSGLVITLVSVTLIAERRRLALQLREREELFRLFIDHAPAALAMLDGELRYLAVSRRWLDDYGLGDRDIIGLSHYEVFPDVPASWKE
jgi:PAS domain-containing protein